MHSVMMDELLGHYQDSEGLYHGVILEDGELRQYDFPGAVQTEIYGISDATGALTGNFIDASGVRRGFSGDTIVEGPRSIGNLFRFCELDGPYRGQAVRGCCRHISCIHAWGDG